MSVYQEEKVWEKHWDMSTARLLGYYKQAFAAILQDFLIVAGRDLSTLTAAEEAMLLAQIAQQIKQLEKKNKAWVEKEIMKAFYVGQASGLTQLGYASSLNQAMKNITKNQFSKRTIDAVMTDTFNDLLYATENTDKRTKKLVKDTFSSAFRQKRIQNIGRDTLTREITQTLSKEFINESLRNDAFVGIVDKANRKWKLEDYVKMATQSKIQDSFRQGVIVESIERGYDLAYISDHSATDNCRKYEGLIVSLTGQTPGYPSLDDIRSNFGNEIFHPNCKHKLRPVRTAELIPANVKAKNEVNRKNVSSIL